MQSHIEETREEIQQSHIEEAREEIQTDIDIFIERISNDKGIHKNHFSEWKGRYILSVVEKRHTLKNKISCNW